MKSDDDPWEKLVTLPEPKLAPDFARRVLRQARIRKRRRRFRRRLMVACVFSAVLGFVATTVIRPRLAQKNTAQQLSGALTRSGGGVPNSALRPSDGVSEKPESPAINHLVLSGRLVGETASADAAIGNAHGTRKLALDSSTSEPSQTLVLSPSTSDEHAIDTRDGTLPADIREPSIESPPAQSAGLPEAVEAGGTRQPSIHVP